MPDSFSLTPKQTEALRLIGGPAQHVLLEGGSRSGKTFLWCRAFAVRALAASRSRHAMLRFRFNHIKASIVLDTWPKMMGLCYPQVPYHLDRSDWFVRFPNESEIWFGGLDDKERTEKILGQEYATMLFNEGSQLPYPSVQMALTRLAQRCTVDATGKPLRLKAGYDCNPPSQAHWMFQVFHRKRDPETKRDIPDPEEYAHMLINPRDNEANLPPEYIRMLERLPPRMRVRFLEGRYADATPGALWTLETIEKWRSNDSLPDMQRIVVAGDPSGSGDTDNADNDEIGIIVAGLGTDGNAYVLEDLTVKAGPEVWGGVMVSGFDRHDADVIVAETNFGGDMVRFVVQAAASKPDRLGKRKPPFKKLTASRGKVVRAEPISALHEQGKIRLAGYFPELEDELCGFTTNGYIGTRSPNRADAMIWAISELFPGMTKEPAKERTPTHAQRNYGTSGWMA